eukprot:tig00020564_g11449.t1
MEHVRALRKRFDGHPTLSRFRLESEGLCTFASGPARLSLSLLDPPSLSIDHPSGDEAEMRSSEEKEALEAAVERANLLIQTRASAAAGPVSACDSVECFLSALATPQQSQRDACSQLQLGPIRALRKHAQYAAGLVTDVRGEEDGAVSFRLTSSAARVLLLLPHGAPPMLASDEVDGPFAAAIEAANEAIQRIDALLSAAATGALGLSAGKRKSPDGPPPPPQSGCGSARGGRSRGLGRPLRSVCPSSQSPPPAPAQAPAPDHIHEPGRPGGSSSCREGEVDVDGSEEEDPEEEKVGGPRSSPALRDHEAEAEADVDAGADDFFAGQYQCPGAGCALCSWAAAARQVLPHARVTADCGHLSVSFEAAPPPIDDPALAACIGLGPEPVRFRVSGLATDAETPPSVSVTVTQSGARQLGPCFQLGEILRQFVERHWGGMAARARAGAAPACPAREPPDRGRRPALISAESFGRALGRLVDEQSMHPAEALRSLIRAAGRTDARQQLQPPGHAALFLQAASLSRQGDAGTSTGEEEDSFEPRPPLPPQLEAAHSPVAQLAAYMQLRLGSAASLTGRCVSCDAPHEFREGLRPAACPRELCTLRYQELGVGSRVESEIASCPVVVDLLLSLAYVALYPSARRHLVFNPLPPSFSDFDGVRRVLEAVPPLPRMREALGLGLGAGSGGPPGPCPGLRAGMAAAGDPLAYGLVFHMRSSGPEKEARFRRLRTAHGSMFAFHGSPACNWHGILRRGLLNCSGTAMQAVGAAYGSGIYLGLDARTSLACVPLPSSRR